MKHVYSLLIIALLSALQYSYAAETEPNNTPAQANVLALNGSNSGKINTAGDIDWWSVTTTADGKLNITLTPAGKKLWIYLYDNNGTTLLASHDSVALFTQSLDGLAAGTYYIKVAAFTPTDTASYTISNTLTTITQANDAEPNNNKLQALLLSNTVRKTGHVGYYYNTKRDTADWYKIITTVDQKITLKLQPTNGQSLSLTLYAGNGTSVISSANGTGLVALSIDGTHKDSFFVKVNANKTSCVVGEPILVTYELFTRLRSQSKVAKQPAINGCTVYEMTTEDQLPQIAKYKGKEYKSYIIRKIQLFPLQAGDLKLDVASVDNEITLFKRNSSGNMTPVTQSVTVSSEPLTIHVNPLPEKNKPAEFNGTIGNFNISAKANKIIDTAEDNNILEIAIEGYGNFQSINCPKINWPKNTEHFDNTEKSDINKMAFPASGTKTFFIPFIAKQSGKIIIPPIEFTYLDISSNQYKTVRSDSIMLTVAPALKKGYELNKISQDITNHKYIWIVPAIALLAGISWWLRFGRKNQQLKNESIAVTEHAKEEIITAPIEEEKISEPIVITDADKLNELLTLETDKQFFTQAKQLAIELLQKQKDDLKNSGLLQIIEQCNEALYSPIAIVNKETVFTSLEKLI